MDTQQERNRQDGDDMQGSQSDSTRSQNRQAASAADQDQDRHSNEGGKASNEAAIIPTRKASTTSKAISRKCRKADRQSKSRRKF